MVIMILSSLFGLFWNAAANLWSNESRLLFTRIFLINLEFYFRLICADCLEIILNLVAVQNSYRKTFYYYYFDDNMNVHCTI